MRDELKVCPNCRTRLVLYRKDVMSDLWTCKSCFMIIHYNNHPGIEESLRDKDPGWIRHIDRTKREAIKKHFREKEDPL